MRFSRKDMLDDYTEKLNIITNSIIYGNGQAGIKVLAGVSLKFYNNTVYDNSEEGITFYGIDHSVGPLIVNSYLTNNIISNNVLEGIRVLQSGPNTNHVDANYNLYYNNGAINSELSSDTNFVTGNPKFTNTIANNFHLEPGSPAIDAAIALIEVTNDFDQRSRPQGSAPDIGSYEFNGSSSSSKSSNSSSKSSSSSSKSSSNKSSSSSSGKCKKTKYNLPKNLVEIITYPINNIPPGINNKWSDFNKLHRLWSILERNSGLNQIISRYDLPPEPKVEDYSDLED
jgi:hypothetical protein